MDIKSFFKNNIVGYILTRILLAGIVVVVLSWLTLIVLDDYTRKGEAIEVPDLRGLYQEEAANILRAQNLYIEVIDSVYNKQLPLGTIVEQIPSAGSSVKQYRSIFLILNKKESRTIPLPDVNDISFRQADALLRSLGLNVSHVEYRPSEFKDLVITVRYQGESIDPGTRLPEAASLVLIVGSGIGDDLRSVPFLLGSSLSNARSDALTYSFIIGAVNYDVPPMEDEASYKVYRQLPSPGETAMEGTRINLWLTKDSMKIEEAIKSGNHYFEDDNDKDESFF
jgi:beta-lactam-binding protein with PASTA domain